MAILKERDEGWRGDSRSYIVFVCVFVLLVFYGTCNLNLTLNLPGFFSGVMRYVGEDQRKGQISQKEGKCVCVCVNEMNKNLPSIMLPPGITF